MSSVRPEEGLCSWHIHIAHWQPRALCHSRDACLQTWKEMGFKSLEDFLVNFWEKFFLAREPNNLLCMLSTWWNGNIGNTEGFDGNLETALASIKVSVTAWTSQ